MTKRKNNHMQEEGKTINSKDNTLIRKKQIVTNTILFLVAVILLFGTYKAISYLNSSKQKQDTNQVIVDPNAGKVRRKIDGVYVSPEKSNLYPMSFMIDNYPSARPQAGLSQANLVIEAEAEGGITRYLAIYASGDSINKIGPIRSARTYFADWANEYSAVYGHCGGSPDALVNINQNEILDFDEFYNGKYFWRDSSSDPSHDLFTSSELFQSYLQEKKLEQGKYFSWYFKDEAPMENRPNSGEISIGYILEQGKVKWIYDKEKNAYIRYLAGTLHEDEQKQPITAKNVVIQAVPAEEVDELLRLDMEYIGEGDAQVCFDGVCNQGKWKKSDNRSRTRFYQIDGKEFEFNAGTTWIEVIRPDIKIEITSE